MPSSSSSSSSSSSFSSSSSSSFHGFVINANSVEEYGQFEIISQTGNSFLINTGRAYDGYGNMIVNKTRFYGAVSFPYDCSVDGTGAYGYLCVKRNQNVNSFDYMDHPVTGIPVRTKTDVGIEFYVVIAVVQVDFGARGVAYFPPVDSNGVINGIVIGKVYQNAVGAPNMFFRSPALETKNGTPLMLPGFNLL